MRRGTLKIFSVLTIGSLAMPFSVEARPVVGQRDVGFSNFNSNFGNNGSTFPDLRGQQFRSNGTEDVDSNGRLISQVNDFRNLAGGAAGTHDPFNQTNRAVLENRIVPGNHVQLGFDSNGEGSGLQAPAVTIGINDRVKKLQEAARNQDENAAIAASREIWDWMTRAGLNHRFHEGSTTTVRIDDLGQALCVDGEIATGEVQNYLEKGFKGAKIDFIDQEKNGLRSYSPNSDPGNGGASSVFSGAVAALDIKGTLLNDKTATDTDEEDPISGDESPSSPVRAPRPTLALDETSSSPARAPRGSVPSDTPTSSAYGNCAPTPFNNFDQNQNQDKNNNNKNAKNKNPGEKNPGDPKSPPPENPPPQGGGGQGGGGGEPKELEKVEIPKGQPAQAFRGPNAEADNFNYLGQIAEQGKFDSQYDYGKIIRGMEANNVEQVRIRADFLAATPIVRYGGGVPGGQTAATSNRSRLQQQASPNTTRDQPFNGLFGQDRL